MNITPVSNNVPLTSNFNREAVYSAVQGFISQVINYIPVVLTLAGILIGSTSFLIHIAAVIGGSLSFLLSLIITLLLWVVSVVIRYSIQHRPAVLHTIVLTILEECIYFSFTFMVMVWLWAIIDRYFGVVTKVDPSLSDLLYTITSGMDEFVRETTLSLSEYAMLAFIVFIPVIFLTWMMTKLIKDSKKHANVWIFTITMAIFGSIGYGIYHHEYAWTKPFIPVPEIMHTLILFVCYIAPFGFYLKTIFFGHRIVSKIVGN